MRDQTGELLEKCRVKSGPLATSKDFGFNGAFFINYARDPSIVLKVVSSDGMGWEHVSVSLPNRCPVWAEMCWIKDLSWRDDEAVMQLHPATANYVNNVRFCLHLWRPTQEQIPMPPDEMVGIRALGTIG